MQDTFHVRVHGRIVNPPNPDIAVSLGAVQLGLAKSIIEGPKIIASKSYIIGIGPNIGIWPRGNWNSENAAKMMS